jgi:hypothetical protein
VVEASPNKHKWNDKMAALRAARRAKGLCMKCGDTYNPQHRCPKQVPLHVLEEVLDIFQLDKSDEALSDSTSQESDEELLTLSYCASVGIQGKRTIRLQGLLQGREVLILVYSGSSATFINEQLVQTLKLPLTSTQPMPVTVADGGKLIASSVVNNLTWWSQGNTFTHDTRVLPLGVYDLILGMDWLEKHSPMWVDWKRKEMRFTYQGKRITLVGVKDCTSKCLPLKLKKLKGLIRKGGVAQLVQLSAVAGDSQTTISPEDITELVAQHHLLFQEPKELPPSRSFDHSIPLIEGVKPVNIKPYRYSPAQKDEIERQLREMLENGIIQPSSNPFASPVLLVKKKDGSWRFCVDYRQLNNMIVKNKYPLPIVDELLDELHGARWFSKLDMKSGYHQVRVAQGDEYKTTFKTHNGHWEFKVMPFGLTNAPATFQAAMNAIFENLLRKGVLIFMDDILIYTETLEQHKQILQEVFQILLDNKLFLKQSKCFFAQAAQPQMEYLGHIISGAGVSTDPEKIKAVKSWPPPKDVKQLRAFLSLAGYYRKFIQNYGLMSRPLTDLLKKHTVHVDLTIANMF